MKSIVVSVLALVGMLFIPASIFAATYEYVNTSGNVESEVAANASQALAMPVDKMPTSGVLLVDPPATYEYINIYGATETETAGDAAQALAAPTDKAPTSGVLLVS